MNNSSKYKNESSASTINQEEIDHFSKDSAHWWDENGPFGPLHKVNPIRMSFIKEQICSYYEHDYNNPKSLMGLDILDVGCGGGLVCEPLARMGGIVTGLDADSKAIEVANKHAKAESLKINYINNDLANLEGKYDVILALEIIEHVNDIPLFIKQCIARLKPNGLLIMSTINRTPKSFALGIVAAEYILRWVPRGTHSWRKFVKPSEIVAHARSHGLAPIKLNGLKYSPINREFMLSENDIDVNYLISLGKRQ